MLTREYIKKCALEAGFDLCGVARARVLSEHAARFATGLEASGDGVLGYLARDPARRLDPSSLVADAKTVVVCALRYDDRPIETPAGRVSTHRRLGEYQPVIKGMLREMLERLQAGAEPEKIRARVCCDTSAILEKAWAVEAGLGWQGRNTLLINPLHGSFLLLGEIVLDAGCDIYDQPLNAVNAGSKIGCGECRACVEACPTGALGETPDGARTVDTRRCISALTIERSRLEGVEPTPIHGWIHGCDECQLCCPHNTRKKATPPHTQQKKRPRKPRALSKIL